MILTLAELNAAATRLPDPQIAAEWFRDVWRVPIEKPIPVSPVTDETPVRVELRFVTFKLKKIAKRGVVGWRWSPADEIII